MTKKTTILAVLIPAAFFAIGMGLFRLVNSPAPKTEITTEKMSGDGGRGHVIAGRNNTDKAGRLSTDDTVVYESTVLPSSKPASNAAILQWQQDGESGDVVAGFRVYDGSKWTPWVESDSDEGGKDGAPVNHAALVLADKIHKIQYRFELSADESRVSPELDLTSASIELVDTTKGPSPTRKSTVSQFLDRTGLLRKASAESGDPRIITRAEWGAPEVNSSVRWEPEYRRLDRVVVHHTAAASSGDSAAAVRAVWYFQADGRGWGDIGYNYLVDQAGNIFEGRYYDKNFAEKNSVDVVGGHALVYNYGSTGISAIGDFTNMQPSDAMLRSISDLAAFKLYRYNVNPNSWTGDLPALVGHRDVNQTGCPMNIHNHLTTLRNWAASKYSYYQSRPFSYSDYDVVKGMNSPAVYVVINNQLRPIGGAGQRDCFIMAYAGRMRSVSDASIASLSVGSSAGACSPPNYTWFYPESGAQQYVLLYGGMYPVGMGDLVALSGINKARPLSNEGIQYLHDTYVSPQIPGNILVKGATQPAVYEADGDTLQHVASADTRDCLVGQIGEVKLVPDSLVSSYQSGGKITGGTASCATTSGLIMHPNGAAVAQIVSGERRYVSHPAIRDCIIGRTGAGTPYRVTQTVWDSFSAGTDAFCSYDASMKFVKEANSPAVWRIFADGTKKHADGFCVVDPFTTPLTQYRVWVVPAGETSGHVYDGVFNATNENCAAISA